ncbi:GGDEF domain-containing protein [Thalassospira marina]|uniref:diguanylate cyclase n=1 Tax=Thalassospira marina TaxID=2048283 RepID=A0A2N3KYS8_9PROT|nr:GGDEF domain-containing protein [Thalassospira marina]PKR55722.1 GGDEF domain-containing protein [Thalassospira marina]
MRRAFFACISVGLIPLVILAAVTALVFGDKAGVLPDGLVGFMQFRPFMMAILGIVLGGWFSRGRVVYAMLVLAFCYWFFIGAPVVLSPEGVRFLRLATLYVVPVNLLLLSFMSERGVFRKRGIARLLFLALQFFALILFATRPDLANALYALLNTRFIELDGIANTIPQLAFLVSVPVVLVLLAKGRSLEFAFACTLPAVFAAELVETRYIPFGYLAAMGVVLGGVVQEAWRMAFVDDLTGLAGRRALGHALMELSGQYCIAMLDVDHFKKFNDSHGHDVGDIVLRKVARELSHVGGGGKAFRYGGEEFSILFSGRDMAKVYETLENLRKKIANSKITLPESTRQVGITVSIGLAQRPESETDPWAVLKEADGRLFCAKEAGRNRIFAG